VGTIRFAGLQQTHKKDEAIIQSPLKSDLFPGILTPLQLALLYKKVLSAVPARYFHCIQECGGKMSVARHAGPPRYVNAVQEPLAMPGILLKMRVLSR
jgi:hypothetical protein